MALVSSVLMALALYMVFIFVPTEATMGVVQRIFYFHVPVAWVALFAYFVVFAGSIMYLVKRQPFWDRLAHASGEIGFVFNTMFLITGSIWAKPIWGVWWTWTPRLTSALILWFIYIGYLLVRAYAAEEAKGARFAAVVGIIGFLDVPIVILAVTLWGSVHPGPIIFEGGLAPSMLLTLQVGIAAFTALYALLMVNNLELRRSEREIKRLKYDLEVS
ncbi:MAG: cytochrome c biogenesis protein CcsA [Chloroflexi bacterium]|nr:cytochrome c biogenesis protein CcsA [Chloroflexota bacterium]